MASVFLTEKSTKDDVLEFLKENGFEELIEVFKANEVDGEDFFDLDFRTINSLIPKLKTRKRFMAAWTKETRMTFDVNGDRVPDESEARKPNGNLPEIAQTSSEKEKDADMLVLADVNLSPRKRGCSADCSGSGSSDGVSPSKSPRRSPRKSTQKSGPSNSQGKSSPGTSQIGAKKSPVGNKDSPVNMKGSPTKSWLSKFTIPTRVRWKCYFFM